MKKKVLAISFDMRHFYDLKIISFCAIFMFSIVAYAQSGQCLDGRYADIPLFDSTEIVVDENVVYANSTHFLTGQNTTLQMDVWYPDMNTDPIGERPLILLTHGGAFAAGNRSAMNYQCMEYARRGFVAATISYRLGWNCDPNVGVLLCGVCGPLQNNIRLAAYSAVQDHRAALRYLFAQAADYGIDTNWIFVGGESAGSIATLASVYWDQSEANAFVPSAFASLGGLDESGNNLPALYSVKGVVDNCGAVFDLNDIESSDVIPVISFHDENDCVVPYASGNVLGCLGCTAFPYSYGSSLIYNKLSSLNVCAELNTVQLSLGHCTWPSLYLVKRASCFLKRTMCEVCTNSTNFNIYASSPCASLGTDQPSISGCTYPNAFNYLPSANMDNGSCLFPDAGCPADLNNDNIVTVADLMIFLGQYGLSCD